MKPALRQTEASGPRTTAVPVRKACRPQAAALRLALLASAVLSAPWAPARAGHDAGPAPDQPQAPRRATALSAPQPAPSSLRLSPRGSESTRMAFLDTHPDVVRAVLAGEFDLGIVRTGTDGITTFVNPSACRILEYTTADLLGRHLHSPVHQQRPDGRPYPSHECPMYMASHDGTVHRGDDEVLFRRDGTAIPVAYSSRPIMERGRSRGHADAGDGRGGAGAGHPGGRLLAGDTSGRHDVVGAAGRRPGDGGARVCRLPDQAGAAG